MKIQNMKNKHLKRAIENACDAENTTIRKWCLRVGGISNVQISTLPTRNLERSTLAIVCARDSWVDKASADKITIAALNDFIEDIGRSTVEFDIKASGKPSDNALAQDLRTLELFAQESPEIVKLIHNMAALINKPSNKDAEAALTYRAAANEADAKSRQKRRA